MLNKLCGCSYFEFLTILMTDDKLLLNDSKILLQQSISSSIPLTTIRKIVTFLTKGQIIKYLYQLPCSFILKIFNGKFWRDYECLILKLHRFTKSCGFVYRLRDPCLPNYAHTISWYMQCMRKTLQLPLSTDYV